MNLDTLIEQAHAGVTRTYDLGPYPDGYTVADIVERTVRFTIDALAVHGAAPLTEVPGELLEIFAEWHKATGRFGPMRSAHEGFAVLREEVDELWDEVKANDAKQAREEAVQVGAMALRFLVDVCRGAAGRDRGSPDRPHDDPDRYRIPNDTSEDVRARRTVRIILTAVGPIGLSFYDLARRMPGFRLDAINAALVALVDAGFARKVDHGPIAGTLYVWTGGHDENMQTTTRYAGVAAEVGCSTCQDDKCTGCGGAL